MTEVDIGDSGLPPKCHIVTIRWVKKSLDDGLHKIQFALIGDKIYNLVVFWYRYWVFYFIHPKIKTPKSLGIGHRGSQSLHIFFWYQYLVFSIIDPKMKTPTILGIGHRFSFC